MSLNELIILRLDNREKCEFDPALCDSEMHIFPSCRKSHWNQNQTGALRIDDRAQRRGMARSSTEAMSGKTAATIPFGPAVSRENAACSDALIGFAQQLFRERREA
jgi:hypothetical protein